jgi:hypothetical protein
MAKPKPSLGEVPEQVRQALETLLSPAAKTPEDTEARLKASAIIGDWEIAGDDYNKRSSLVDTILSEGHPETTIPRSDNPKRFVTAEGGYNTNPIQPTTGGTGLRRQIKTPRDLRTTEQE